MGLSNFNFNQKVVSTSGGDIPVSGLSLNDLMRLTQTHAVPMAALFDRITAQGLGDDAISSTAQLLAGFPDLAAGIIASGAGEGHDPAQVALAKRIPFPDQVALLEAIGESTFATAGGAKKFLETVTRVMSGTTSLLRELSSGNGSGTSVSK